MRLVGRDGACQWFLEDFPEGQRLTTARRTVTQADLVNFIGLGGFFEEIFMVADTDSDREYGRQIVPGYLTLTIAEGLVALSGMMHNAVGLLGLDDTRWTAPVGCGDTVSATLHVTGVRRTHHGDRGVLSIAHSVTNQDGVEVMRYRTARLIRTREKVPATPAGH